MIMIVGDDAYIVLPRFEKNRNGRMRASAPTSHTTLTLFDRFCIAIHSVVNRYKKQRSEFHSALLLYKSQGDFNYKGYNNNKCRYNKTMYHRSDA